MLESNLEFLLLVQVARIEMTDFGQRRFVVLSLFVAGECFVARSFVVLSLLVVGGCF